MNRTIPSLQLLCLYAFPFEEIVKDENQLMELLDYPKQIVSKIISRNYIYEIEEYKGFGYFYGIDDKFNFYTIDRRDIIITNIKNKNIRYIQKTIYKNCMKFLCKRCDSFSIPYFNWRYGSSLCCYCTFRTTNKYKDRVSCAGKTVKIQDEILSILKKDITSNIMYIVKHCGANIYVLTSDQTRKFQSIINSYETFYSANNDDIDGDIVDKN